MFLTILLSALLHGTVIGTTPSVDYTTGQASTTINTPSMAFDGDMNTYFASYDRSYTWCGLDLGKQHIITRIGWSPRNDGHGEKRVQLAVFEGANTPDFMDAIPLYIVPEQGTIGKMSYADIHCSRAFRYVRYIGPDDARCNVAEVEFYGVAGQGDDSQLPTLSGLPVVSIHTEGNVHPVDKVNDIPAIVSIIHADGRKIATDSATTRLRGNYSMGFPKKPYRIKFNSKTRVLDAPAKAKKWTLINNYGDKTLLRNLLAFELSRQMGLQYTPYGTPVDVVFNGEYKGCYQLCDQVEVGSGRVELTKEDGSFFIEVDAYADQEADIAWFNSAHGNPVTIKYPDEEDITWPQHDAIKQHFERMESNKRQYLDYRSFLQHFLVGELSGNTDTYWSTYMYRYAGNDTIFVGPVWDFDIAFENDNRTYPINNHSDYIYRSGGSTAGQMRRFVDAIVIEDSEAKQQLADIYADARDHGFSAEVMSAYIDSLASMMSESQRLNFLRWPIMNQQVHMNPKTYGNYEGEVRNVRDYMIARIAWMDRKLGYVPSEEQDITTTTHNPQVIKVYLDGQIYILRDNTTYNIMGQPAF